MLAETILLAVLVLHFVNVVYKRWKYDLHKIPSPNSLPLFGHIFHLRKFKSEWHLRNWLESWSECLQGAKVLHLQVKGKSWLYINDPEYAKHHVLSNVEQFPRTTMTKWKWAPMMTDEARKVELMLFSGGLTPHIKSVRQAYVQSFQSTKLREMVPELHSVADQMIRVIETRREHGLVDFQDILLRTSLDLLGVSAFDTNFGGLDHSRQLCTLLTETGHYTRYKSSKPVQQLIHKLLPFLKEPKAEKEAFRQLMDEWSFIAKEIIERDEVSEKREFWSLLRKMYSEKKGKGISFEQLSADIATCVIIGVSVTGYQLSWIVALLASHPEVVDKLLEEFKSHKITRDHSNENNYDELIDLPYLSAVVKEGMRVASAYCFIGPRETAEDMEVLGYKVPKGVGIIIPANVGTDARIAPVDPHEFSPERWMTVDKNGVKDHGMSFSCGPRDCPAERLALLQMHLVIVRLVTKYELTLHKNSVLELLEASRNGFALEAIKGVWIEATPRSSLNKV